MKKLWKRVSAIVMSAIMVVSLAAFDGSVAEAAEKLYTIIIGESTSVKCSKESEIFLEESYKWSVTEGADIVTLSNSEKREVKVSADKEKAGRVTLKCQYTIKEWNGFKKVTKEGNEEFVIDVEKKTPVYAQSISNLTYNGTKQNLNAADYVPTELASVATGVFEGEIPLNAGEYKYVVSTSETDVYKAGTKTYTVIVDKAEVKIAEKPVATINHVGGVLSDSYLNGGKAVAAFDTNQVVNGHFEWEDPEQKLVLNATGTAIFDDVDHHVVFVPEGQDAQNFKSNSFLVSVRTYLKALQVSLQAKDFEYTGTNDGKNLSCNASAYSWGNEKNPNISISYTYYDANGQKLEAVPVDAGTYQVMATASAKGYESANSNLAEFTISQKAITVDMVSEPTDTSYTGNIIPVIVKDGEKVLKVDKDYTVSYSGTNPNVGETTATITGKGNYTGTVNVTYTILPKNLENEENVSIVVTAATKYYTGSAVTLEDDEVVVSYNGQQLEVGKDYTVGEYTDNIQAGKASAIVTFTGNYSGTAKINFDIQKIYAKVYTQRNDGTWLALAGRCVLAPSIMEQPATYIATDAETIKGYVLEDENKGYTADYTWLQYDYKEDTWRIEIKVTDAYTESVEFFVLKAGEQKPEGTEVDSAAKYQYVGKAQMPLNSLSVRVDLATSGIQLPSVFHMENSSDGKTPTALADVLEAYAQNSGIENDEARFYTVSWYRMVRPDVWHVDGEIIDNSYTVTFIVDGQEYAKVREVKGTAVTVKNPSKAESETATYEFAAWMLDENTVADLANMNKDTVVYAYFNEKEKTPVEPVEPTDPVNPVEPVEPTDPVNPVEPVEPTDPVNPVEPVEPTDPDASVDNTPVDDIPVDNTPVDDIPVDNAPVDDTPVDNTPVDNTPVDNTPVDNAPVDDAPVDNTPVVAQAQTAAPVVTSVESTEEEVEIEEEEVPLAATSVENRNCSIHWLMVILTVLFVAYNMIRIYFRKKENA